VASSVARTSVALVCLNDTGQQIEERVSFLRGQCRHNPFLGLQRSRPEPLAKNGSLGCGTQQSRSPVAWVHATLEKAGGLQAIYHVSSSNRVDA
jgi:hypothetical protein